MRITIVMFPVIFVLLGISLIVEGTSRSSSYPYITGDGFRSYADFIIDYRTYGDWHTLDEINKKGEPFVPEQVQQGDVIFVNNDMLDYFFEKHHACIANSYILLTHNGDYDIPGKYAGYLDDPKIIAWFGDMVIQYHPKLYPIPLGIANNYWPHGDIAVAQSIGSRLPSLKKNKLLYLNIKVATNKSVRSEVIMLFSTKPFCTYVSHPKKWEQYLYDVATSKFVLSPRGNGIDCHRTWEALLMGSYPIVQRSALDSMFEGLPVLIIDDWHEVTKEFLEKKYEQMKTRQYDYYKLNLQYWLDQIDVIKSRSRKLT